MKNCTFHRPFIFQLILISITLGGILGPQQLSAQNTQPHLLKDINPGPDSSRHAALGQFHAVANDIFYFAADDGVHGKELWISDGTTAGTQFLKDIYPGLDGPWDYYQFYSASFNGEMYFNADDGIHGNELWKTDGTPQGTVLVKDITPGSTYTFIRGFINFNDLLYFSANDIFWVTDGTEEGTKRVKNIVSPVNPSNKPFFEHNNKLYFSADDGIHGSELWVSDGTTAGTVMLKEIVIGAGGGGPYNFIPLGEKLFFYADDGIHGAEPWITDGTEEGTHLIKDINPGNSFSEFYSIGFPLNNRVYFNANDGTHGYELWSTDGTEAGTQLVKDINPNNNGSQGNRPEEFFEYNGKVYFAADDNVHGKELWVTDGTEAGTELVKDINSNNPAFPENFMEYNGRLYFATYGRGLGTKVWSTDGTETGTVLSINMDARGMIPCNGKLFFGALDSQYGYNLYESDGTDMGTYIVRPTNNTVINPFVHSSNLLDPAGICFENNLYVLGRYVENTGAELYKLTIEPLSINEPKTRSLTLYPNPTDSELYISSDVPIEKAAVYNLQGRLLISSNFNDSKNEKATLDLSELVVGVYFVKITSGGLEKTYKIIKK